MTYISHAAKPGTETVTSLNTDMNVIKLVQRNNWQKKNLNI